VFVTPNAFRGKFETLPDGSSLGRWG